MLDIIVAYIVDGTIEFVKGHSGSWWVAEAMRWAKTKVQKVFMNKDGSSYGVDSSGCIQSVPHGSWVCPYSL